MGTWQGHDFQLTLSPVRASRSLYLFVTQWDLIPGCWALGRGPLVGSTSLGRALALLPLQDSRSRATQPCPGEGDTFV